MCFLEFLACRQAKLIIAIGKTGKRKSILVFFTGRNDAVTI